MAAYSSTRSFLPEASRFSEGDEITIGNGSMWILQAGSWYPTAFSTGSPKQNITATLSDQGVVKNVIRLTQAQYDALSVKDPETLYVIVG